MNCFHVCFSFSAVSGIEPEQVSVRKHYPYKRQQPDEYHRAKSFMFVYCSIIDVPRTYIFIVSDIHAYYNIVGL
jgi:hypothetical protein